MQFSVAGIAVSGALIMLMLAMRAGTIAVLIGSLAFGATAFVTLNFIGGSTPLIYVIFTMGLLVVAFINTDIFRRLGSVFRSMWTAWIVLAFMVYAMFSAVLMPRLFAGATSVFVPSREQGGVFEVPLAPTTGNISQAGYLMLNCLAFFAVCVLLTRRFNLRDVTRGFFLWAWLNAGFGLIDFFGKYSGLGDLLTPIRTAHYEMLTNVLASGFPRITGAYPEASSFGGASLACLAFAYTQWRRQSSRQAFWLTVITFLLILASTSTTAYAGLAVLSIPVAFSIVRLLGFRSTRVGDLLIVTVFLITTLGVLTMTVVKPQVFEPVLNLIDSVILDKASSASGQERAYWNAKSLQSVADTYGVGVGMGSSRASSWPIAIISQLGIVGFLLVSLLVGVLVRGMRGLPARLEPASHASCLSVRNCALGGLVPATISGGGADPGIVFFVSLAVVVVSRAYITESVNRAATPVFIPRWPWPELNNG